MKRIFVSGGTGYVGSAVLDLLKKQSHDVLFSWYKNSDKAQQICDDSGFESISVDLTEDISKLKERLREFQAEVFIHCAVASENISTLEIQEINWFKVHKVNCQSAFEISECLFDHMTQQKNGDIVLVNGLANSQSFKLPVHFAASQGAQNAMAMALAKEYGKYGIKVNSISLGLLESGLSQKFPKKLHEDFLTFSALQRKGTAKEAAKAICKFALSNTYVSGKNICITGGI